MTVDDCDILIDALDYTMGVLARDGAKAALLREALVINRNEALVKGPPLRCKRCDGTKDVKCVTQCGHFHEQCLSDHERHCERCRRESCPDI